MTGKSRKGQAFDGQWAVLNTNELISINTLPSAVCYLASRRSYSSRSSEKVRQTAVKIQMKSESVRLEVILRQRQIICTVHKKTSVDG